MFYMKNAKIDSLIKILITPLNYSLNPYLPNPFWGFSLKVKLLWIKANHLSLEREMALSFIQKQTYMQITRLIAKNEYVLKGTKFTGLGKLGFRAQGTNYAEYGVLIFSKYSSDVSLKHIKDFKIKTFFLLYTQITIHKPSSYNKSGHLN